MKVKIENQTYVTISIDGGMCNIDDVIRMLQTIREEEIVPRKAEIRHIYIKAPDQIRRMNKIEIEFKGSTTKDIGVTREV